MLDDDSAIAELASGVLSKQIAARYGVTPFAVRKRLAKHPDYKQAIVDQAESFVEAATDEVMNTELSDMVAIGRARVRVDTAHKWAAARDPERWAGKAVQINIGAVLNLDPASVSSIGSLLDRAASQQIHEVPQIPLEHEQE